MDAEAHLAVHIETEDNTKKESETISKGEIPQESEEKKKQESEDINHSDDVQKEVQKSKCICGALCTLDAYEQGIYYKHCFLCHSSQKHMHVCTQCDKSTCDQCMEFFDSNDFHKMAVKAIHRRESFYYIYNDGQIMGPHTLDEVISLYVLNRFGSNVLYVMSAGDPAKKSWHKLHIPDITLDHHDSAREVELAQFQDRNKEIKDTFPDLYYQLVENVFTTTLQPVFPTPHDIPFDEQRSNKKQSCVSMMMLTLLLGRVLAIFMLLVIILHIVAFAIIGLCFIKITEKVAGEDYNELSDKTFFILYVIVFLGMIASPFVVVYVLMVEMEMYDEIQSWQIAYCVWGFMCFTMTMAYMATILLIDDDKRKQRRLKSINKVTLYIVGVDFGQLDLTQIIEDAYIDDIITGKDMGVILLLLMPQLAGLLPAAITGFIANYILQEKFELKCRESIVNKNICFDSEYGCCEVISSHNWVNTYAFMGGLASNILATWAVIRICGYLLVNAYPQFSVYAKRRTK